MKKQIFTKRKLNQSIIQYALLCLIILAIGGFYGYIHYTEYQAASTAFETEKALLSELKADSDQAKMDYTALKKDIDAENVGVNQAIEQILPSNEDFTDLARELDKYFLNTATTANPVFLSDLRFAPPQVTGEKEFAILPFSMNISANELSLNDFLEYVENSGDLNDRTRLLDIGTLNISYQSPGSSSSPTGETATVYNPNVRDVSASLNMRAFFQKPVDEMIP